MTNKELHDVLQGIYFTAKQFLKEYADFEGLVADPIINGSIDQLSSFVNAFDSAIIDDVFNNIDQEKVPEDVDGIDENDACAEGTGSGKWEKLPPDIGSCTVVDSNVLSIDKEWYMQGYVFKSWKSFYDKANPDQPCYSPELNIPDEGPEIWTRAKILELCGGNEAIAERVFENLEWQSPSTELDELERDGEVDTCSTCGKMFLSYEAKKCPYCGAPYDPEENVSEPEEKKYYVSYSGSTIVFAKDEDEACEIAADKISLDEINAHLMRDDGSIEER